MKSVFMGTPEFAVAPLKALCEDGHEISLVVTQPDKPKGRGQKMLPPEVKVFAESRNISVYQPKSMKTDEAFERLSAEKADLFVVVAFGKILPQRILDIPKHGSINMSMRPCCRNTGALRPFSGALSTGKRKLALQPYRWTMALTPAICWW